MATQWWKLQNRGQSQPYGLAALVDGDGLPRRFVPGEGLVDWPSLAGELLMGESGADPISEDEAKSLMVRVRVASDVVRDLRGKAPTIKVPM